VRSELEEDDGALDSLMSNVLPELTSKSFYIGKMLEQMLTVKKDYDSKKTARASRRANNAAQMQNTKNEGEEEEEGEKTSLTPRDEKKSEPSNITSEAKCSYCGGSEETFNSDTDETKWTKEPTAHVKSTMHVIACSYCSAKTKKFINHLSKRTGNQTDVNTASFHEKANELEVSLKQLMEEKHKVSELKTENDQLSVPCGDGDRCELG